MSELSELKRQTRERVLDVRDAIPPKQRERKSGLICLQLEEIAQGAASETGDDIPLVAVYHAMKSEVDVSDFIDWAYGHGWRVAFPCMIARDQADGAASSPLPQMRFRNVPHYLYEGSADCFFRHPLKAYGFDDPAVAACPLVNPREITMAVVPLVAFDGNMMRLGYGAGCYDRFLPLLRDEAAVCGAGFKEQQVLEVPAEPHDMALPQLATA